MALDWENPVNFSNQIYPFEQQYQQQQQFYQDPDELLLQLETELLCFDSAPPTLFDVDDLIIDPAPPQQLDHLQNYDQNCLNHELIIPKTNDFDNSPYSGLDFPPPLLLPAEENFSLEEDCYTQFEYLPLPKKQRVFVPCFDGFVPELIAAPENPNCYNNLHHDNSNNGDVGSYNVGDYNGGSTNKTRAVSAQSKAARERRRKITEKTQELGKLVPGGTKMNTAEMLQAAFKYVKFLQAQLGILQSMKTLQEESDKKINLDNLSILASPSVQEKLYAKEKCLVPLDLLPMIEEHCDFEINPSTSQQPSDLVH